MIDAKKYTLLAIWAAYEGTLEIGNDYNTRSLVRLINEGGFVWQDEGDVSLEEALNQAEAYLKNDFERDFGYKVGA
ncbi:MAG: hypothetical protein AAF806_28200 [Bacteroidota bacterium]